MPIQASISGAFLASCPSLFRRSGHKFLQGLGVLSETQHLESLPLTVTTEQSDLSFLKMHSLSSSLSASWSVAR